MNGRERGQGVGEHYLGGRWDAGRAVEGGLDLESPACVQHLANAVGSEARDVALPGAGVGAGDVVVIDGTVACRLARLVGEDHPGAHDAAAFHEPQQQEYRHRQYHCQLGAHNASLAARKPFHEISCSICIVALLVSVICCPRTSTGTLTATAAGCPTVGVPAPVQPGSAAG